MPNKFEKVIKQTLMTVAIVAAVGIIVVCVLLVLKQFDAVEKKAGLGDVFTVVSIIVAAVITRWSWSRADKNAQDERQRLAMADATILHHRLNQVGEEVICLLLDLMIPTDQGLTKLIVNLEGHAETDLLKVRGFFSKFALVSENKLENFPDTSGYYEAIRSLFVADRTFGGLVVKVLSHIDALRTGLAYYKYGPLDFTLANSRTIPAIDKEFFFDFLANITTVLVGLEILRRKLQDVKFAPSPTNTALVDLEKQLNIVLGNEGAEPSDRVGPDEYLDMLWIANKYFEKKGTGVEQSAVSQQPWDF